VVLAGLGVALARAGLRVLADPPGLERTNFRGRPVSLAAGPVLAVAASASAAAGARNARTAAAVLVAGLGSGAVGRYDDVVGGRPEHQAKGFRGHLRALRQGRLTSGVVKIAGVGAAAVVASALLPADGRGGRVRRGVDVLLGAGVIAGSANLVNLLDLRPGRAAKVGLLVGTPLLAGRSGGLVAGPVGAAAAVLPDDLDESVMLGDSGANALGALLGAGFVARTGTAGRAAAFAGLAALTAASERVSFTQVIERTPALRRLDELGRCGEHAGSARLAPRSDPEQSS
jgi:UDP-N-acetylmuramyl pentapeptide phosphotransferase/UDP-N-acetylglucosamine-1-phosphate transferase